MTRVRLEHPNKDSTSNFTQDLIDITVITKGGPIFHSIPIVINKNTGRLSVLYLDPQIHNQPGQETRSSSSKYSFSQLGLVTKSKDKKILLKKDGEQS